MTAPPIGSFAVSVRGMTRLLVLVMVSTSFTFGSAPSAAGEASSLVIVEGARARSEFGLPSDIATVRALVESGQDAGSVRWGIPMTSHEMARIDMSARVEYANAFAASVGRYVRQLPSYAGLWFDQTDNSRPTVLLTTVDAATEAAIRALDPDSSRGLRV